MIAAYIVPGLGSIVAGPGHLCLWEGDVSTHRYRITIAGGLGEIGREAFADFLIEPNGTNTVLISDLDEAALYGALNRILSLRLELIELSRLSDRPD